MDAAAELTLTGTLTEDEREVVLLLARGTSRAETAQRLNSSPTTVARLMQRVYAKTSAVNTVHAITILCQRGELNDLSRQERPTVLPSLSDGPACQALHARLMSELDWRSFQELRIAYRVCSELGL